jgi:hypothetical protein
LLSATSVKAEETNSIKQYNSKVNGTFTLRSWIVNNSVDQFITIVESNNKGFLNSKQSMTMMEMDSNYWFGFITQNQLYTLGPLFGIGVNFAYGKNSFVNLQATQGITADLVSYMLDFDFVRLAIAHNDTMSKYLAFSAHYSSYSNSLSGSNPLNGLGVGIDSQYNVGDFADLFFKLNYIPNANSARLTSAWGANSELGFKWSFSPKAAINVGYKALFYAGQTTGQTSATDNTGKEVPINVNLQLQDILHGVTIGGSYFF